LVETLDKKKKKKIIDSQWLDPGTPSGVDLVKTIPSIKKKISPRGTPAKIIVIWTLQKNWKKLPPGEPLPKL
jgi:hypothetical protein